jgi:hypothetical protein
MKKIILLFILSSCTRSFQSKLIQQTSDKGLILIIRSQNKIAECLNNRQLAISSIALYGIEKNSFSQTSLTNKQVILNVLSNCNRD